jgi:hypothetical protein
MIVRVLKTSRGVLKVDRMRQTRSRVKKKLVDKNLSMHSYIGICPIEWL